MGSATPNPRFEASIMNCISNMSPRCLQFLLPSSGADSANCDCCLRFASLRPSPDPETHAILQLLRFRAQKKAHGHRRPCAVVFALYFQNIKLEGVNPP